MEVEKEMCIAEKKTLRRSVLAVRDALPMEERSRAALLLTERICRHQWFYLSDILLVFVSYGSEIDTSGIIMEALEKGKQVFVPKIMGDEMQFYRIRTLDELQKGYKGILEPSGETERYEYKPQEADRVLMLVPGAVFDWERNRIGYGKGFYDKYLVDKENLQLRTIGVGFKCQMVEQIPTEEWDIRPYQVICE